MAGRGEPAVTVTGDPSELLIFSDGRQAGPEVPHEACRHECLKARLGSSARLAASSASSTVTRGPVLASNSS